MNRSDEQPEPAGDQETISRKRSSNTKPDRLHVLVNNLVQSVQLVSREKPGRGIQSVMTSRDLVGRDLRLYESWLAEAHRQFRDESKKQVPISFTSEWVLDNYYIIRQALQQIKEDLPLSFYKQLPRLTDGHLIGLPRIYIIAHALLAYQHYLLNPVELQNILNLFQERVPLSMGELWALPIFLRYALIESLEHALLATMHAPYLFKLPRELPQVAGMVGSFSTSQASGERPGENEGVPNIILSLRTVSEQDWSEFFESVSCLEKTLREDPGGIYAQMDFKTRDSYRKEIEQLSFATGQDENEIARVVLSLARPEGHIGDVLLGEGRSTLEKKIGYKPGLKIVLKKATFKHFHILYLASILFLTILFLTSLAGFIRLPELLAGNASIQWVVTLVLMLTMPIPALTVATSLVNWLITLRMKPGILPKMSFKNEIPAPFQTLVVIPTLITNHKEIASLVHQLELNYLRNTEPGLKFALLTDFCDADSESLPEDGDLVQQVTEAIEGLNRKYRPLTRRKVNGKRSSDGDRNGTSLFYFLHRRRLWNSSEGKWIGWERKRGKLHELNLLLRGQSSLSFTTTTDGIHSAEESRAALRQVRFVITMDTDTILPSRAACRLAGTLAHPLNQAVFNEKGQVVSGYTILQPRMEIHPKSSNHSWFTRFFAGDSGLDLYTRAVSDVYQDLFEEGIYVGKGIYDVDTFMRSVAGHIPDNTVLSHDLLEGLMGRAALITDITMIEDYPQNYILQSMRQRRWIRGDWQLLPWLVRPRRFGLFFSKIDRWKIFDNLRRSLLAPALLLIFLLGLIFLPGLAGLWTAVVLISPGIPLITGLARSARQVLDNEVPGNSLSTLGYNLMRWLLAIAFLPYEAYFSLMAVFSTLHRMFFSHRDLLQWTSAAHIARWLSGLRSDRRGAWQKMIVCVVLGVMLAISQFFISNISRISLFSAFPVLLLWVASPFLAWWIDRPFNTELLPLKQSQINLLHQVARRTWGFFERFVGPEDHWLPPDHYQESPVDTIAHRTSPTNIGFLLTSTLAAFDLGYLGQLGLATRLATTMETLAVLVRFRGHFMNWYDTMTLQPLQPRYISTVDSGNLAASLIITAQACKTISEVPILRWELWQGYLDAISNLDKTLSGMRKGEFSHQVVDINQKIAAVREEILATKFQPERWYATYLKVTGPFWQDLSKRLTVLVMVGRPAFDLETLKKLQEDIAQEELHHQVLHQSFTELVPWIPLFEDPPLLFGENPFVTLMTVLRTCLPVNLALSQVHNRMEEAFQLINELHNYLAENELRDDKKIEDLTVNQARDWLKNLGDALIRADANAESLGAKFTRVMELAEQFVNEMDFCFLYHSQRRLFHIGFNLATGQLDQNFYDLLASEARITSIIAIAKGDVPQSHWMQLSRSVMQVKRLAILLSWSGTMFEYMMPPLFLRSYQGTLLADSTRGAVLHQIAYGKAKGVPWGVSEAGFYRFDANQNYQYRAFGVPGLGFKRGLEEDLVVAPYASIIAIGEEPDAVVRNLVGLGKYKMVGSFGLFESIDFTSERMPANETAEVVREYMAHHQGMILMALTNFFHEDIMVRRMHSDLRIQSVELLLQEQVPQIIPFQPAQLNELKGVRRSAVATVKINPWKVPIQTPIPQVTLLSNGSYRTIISNMGGGYSSWRDVDLTRWQPDGVLDAWGTWIYIQEPGEEPPSQSTWSVTHQPVPGNAADCEVVFFAHEAVFQRKENGFASTMKVTVTPDDPVEIRLLHIQNGHDKPHTLRFTSYGEVILAPQAADNRHPAFNKLFIESEFIPHLNLQIFTRRRRSDQEPAIFMGHMLVVERNHATVQHEADRYQFIGRDRTMRNPVCLTSQQYLSGTTGATLDPIFALGQEVRLDAHASANLAFLSFAAESRDGILSLARRYSDWATIEQSFRQAEIASQALLGKQEITNEVFMDISQVLSALLFPFKAFRAVPETIAANKLGQSGLWRFGISGDYPILLVELDSPEQIELASEVLQMHRYLRSRGFMMDVVLINYQETNYGAELKGVLYRLVSKLSGEAFLNQRGGIYILHGDHMTAEERILLEIAARVLLTGAKGPLTGQMPGYFVPVHHLPDLTPTRPQESGGRSTSAPQSFPLEEMLDLKFFNGYGGFSRDGREYIIDRRSLQGMPGGTMDGGKVPLPENIPPVPWVNVIGYQEFGFMVSDAGSQCTWAANSSENRLTPWSNDPVCDPTGEALYLRDEETGEVWTPTPLPAGSTEPYRVKHGAGYTTFEHNSHGVRHMLTLFASPEDPVKIIHLKVENTLNHNRRITATQYVEWVLGTNHASSMAYIIPEYNSVQGCLLASNPFNVEFSNRVAFLMASKTLHGLTADRTEFFGRGGTPAFPAALHRLGLENRITPGEDPCAVVQVHIDLLPGGSEEIYFVLGQGHDKEHALELAGKYHNPTYIGAAYERTRVFWDHLLGTVQVHTPDQATDIILNRWMLYQTLSCRIWSRTGFFQSSGAFGFRDQLQDVLAMLSIYPAIPRNQILNAARHQFKEGDVLHWWHPPSGRGVRTRFSDDMLWLPYVTSLYIEVTGDTAILDEKLPFLKGSVLLKDENEHYGEFLPTEKTYTLMDHCRRAIEKGSTRGPHGLPLIGTGDWNDGMNRVGEKGQGESVWLAWFLCDNLKRFAAICEQKGDIDTALRYRSRAKTYAEAVEKSAWDGAWYLRAYYDDGTPYGTINDSECQIDAVAQSWAVLSGVGDPKRSLQAMQSVVERLVIPQERLVLLFTPPFDKTIRDPGYIKGYIPGIRENGGQYTHAATWTAWAICLLGDGKKAGELFDLLNPIFQSDTRGKAGFYRVEPYVISADIYSQPPFMRRGGWTWYTGSAAWMYRLGLEAILGFRKVGNNLHIDPVIPPDWDGFEIRYQFGEASYCIQVRNPGHVSQHVGKILLDGKQLEMNSIPLLDDKQEHQVVVIMIEKGEQSANLEVPGT
jgi:cyclic beta-1,2-glucan synthetase